MAIEDDFSIALNGDIRWTGTTGSYTGLEFHRFLQDNAANSSAATSDDLINISSDNPSKKFTSQIIQLFPPYNVTATEIEHLYDASIVQGSAATEEKWGGLVVVGTVEDGTQPQVIQNDAVLTPYWGTAPTLLNADAAQNIVMRIMVKIRDAGRDIDARKILVKAAEFPATGGADTFAEFSATLGDANAVAAISTSADVFSDTAIATVNAYDKHDVTTGFQAVDIDPGVDPESYYQQWEVNGAGTLPATATKKSLYEYTKAVGYRGTAINIHGRNGFLHRGITHEIDWDGQGANPFVEDDYIAWGTTMAYDNEASGPFTIGEKLTFGTSGAVGTLLVLQDDGLAGVMVVAIEPDTGTVVDNEQITGGTSTATADVDGATRLVDTAAVGGEGLILADDDNGATGTIWIQLVKGSAPTDNLPIHGHDRTAHLAAAAVEAAVNVLVESKTVSPEFIGQYVGNFLGAFGQAVIPGDTTAADQFLPLEGGQAVPPDNRIFSVNGCVIGDELIVGKDGAPDFDTAQMSVATALTTGTETELVVGAIPDNTPAAGTLRIITDTGTNKKVAYSSHDGVDTFTFTASEDFTAPEDVTISNDAWVSYIDRTCTGTTETFNFVFVDDVPGPVRARLRLGGVAPIETAEGTAAFSTGSISLNRISDA